MSIVKRDTPPAPPMIYDFEIEEGESVDDYERFLTFCDEMDDTTYTHAKRKGDMSLLDLAKERRWMERRNAMFLWRNRIRKQQWLTYLDNALLKLTERQEYHMQRLKFAEMLEGIDGLKPEELKLTIEEYLKNMKDKKARGAGTSKQYMDAVKLYNADVYLALQTISALRNNSPSIEINNMNVASTGDTQQSRVKQVAEAWGDIDEPR